jgi:hypothetical protein
MVAATLFAVGTAACTAATTVTDLWRDPTYARPPLRNMLVIGARMDDTNRRALEDKLVAVLGEHAVRATPSYALWPHAFPTAEAARDAVEKSGFDGYLVSTMRGVTERATTMPPDYGFWGGYYAGYGPASPAWGLSPGYVRTDEFVKFETTLWDPRAGSDGKLV